MLFRSPQNPKTPKPQNPLLLEIVELYLLREMGKNPNAKKLKEKKHRERTYSHDMDELEEEASRLGISVVELQE